jgi:hypothetical protein
MCIIFNGGQRRSLNDVKDGSDYIPVKAILLLHRLMSAFAL